MFKDRSKLTASLKSTERFKVYRLIEIIDFITCNYNTPLSRCRCVCTMCIGCLSQQFTTQNVPVPGASIKISICIDTIALITNCSNFIKFTNDKGIRVLTVTIIISDVPVCYQKITSPLWDHVDDMLVFEFPNTSVSHAEHNDRERHQQENGSLHCISCLLFSVSQSVIGCLEHPQLLAGVG